MNEPQKSGVEPDEWASLRTYTKARIALGKTGVSVPLKESLAFKLAHAHAKDAVYSQLQIDDLQAKLAPAGLPIHVLHSQASSRDIYLQRPDFGRRLDDTSVKLLNQLQSPSADICIIVADGLSATAVMRNAGLVVRRLIEKAQLASYSLAPILLVEQGRVAITDAIGDLLRPKLAVILIGERPGLSSFDSLGAYLTYAPKSGLTDERRNCISNIREEGLKPSQAADKIMHLIQAAFRLQLTGIALKEDDGLDGADTYREIEEA
ncbi:ethanolamine ammonia-lyase subunit EutC [Spirosoma sp. BT702]|uniref:Ethanolamine ammonia-lyase small subunit n=1 Tax=Spirosoma profusum TaxID=2771354 RepID=A0A927AQG2_9BACT|nr:ethanolamine ammonia-lyase subunit EutC [Spirosoma profusum]MBD2700346.1 ethanolamine ammonia-lyase subunit EutC [Spirosoma profusum]